MLSPARTDRRRRDRVSARTMDIKKITRNPLFYVLMIGFLLVVGFSLISSLGGAKQISTQEGLELARSTLCGWHDQLGELVRPLVEAMFADALGEPYLCVDATGVLVLAKEKCRNGHF